MPDAQTGRPDVVDDRAARALARMRECAERAHRDARTLVGPLATQAEHRVRLFVEAAADLSGEDFAAEYDRATNAPEPPIWSLR